ncbi:MAG: integrase [Polaribacter sp.]
MIGLDVNMHPKTPMDARKILIEKASEIIKTAYQISLPAKILIEFILDGISSGERWEPGKGTAYRYLNNLNTYWLYLWKDTDITELGPDEASDIYNTLLVKHGIEQKILYDLLPIFYKFISTHYARHVEIPITYFKKYNHVRSKLVPASIFQMARKYLLGKNEDESDIIKKSADCILILAYRAGMRPKEIYDLKLSAISKNAAELFIVVGKTASAARRIPLYILLNDAELKQLEAFVAQRKAQEKKGSKHGKSAYLFKQSHNSNEHFNEKLINRIVTEFISEHCPARTVFYQFRHTLTTNLFLVCFCSNEVVKQFSDYSDEQINKIRDYLTSDENKTCTQISGLIGHLEPNMTISRYCHLMEFCLYESLCNTDYELTIGQWVKQIKTPKAVIAAHLHDVKKSNDPINVSDIQALIIKKLSRYADILQSAVVDKSNFQPSFNNTDSINLDEMIKTCSMTDAGDTVNDISKALATNQYIVAEVLSAVSTIKADPKYFTLRNKSTLTSNISNEYSAPMVSSKIEMQEVTDLFKIFSKNSNEAKEARKAAEQFLNTSIDHNYLIFDSFQKLKKTINALKTLDKKRWHVTVDLPTKGEDQVNLKSLYNLIVDNQIIINRKSVSGKNYPKGRFKLKLVHPREYNLLNKISSQMLVINPTKTDNKYGTNSIKVAIFWALVYLRAEAKYKRFLEDKGISGHMEQLEIDYL